MLTVSYWVGDVFIRNELAVVDPRVDKQYEAEWTGGQVMAFTVNTRTDKEWDYKVCLQHRTVGRAVVVGRWLHNQLTQLIFAGCTCDHWANKGDTADTTPDCEIAGLKKRSIGISAVKLNASISLQKNTKDRAVYWITRQLLKVCWSSD
jgi:hypothetical protein